GVKQRDSDYALAQKLAAEVRRFDRASLKGQDQITYDILLDQWDSTLAYKRFDWLSSEGLYPIAPMWGTQVQLVQFMISGHVVKESKPARNYLRRLQAMGGKLDAVTAEMQRQARLGVVLPLPLLEKAEQGIRDTLAPEPRDNPLVTSFKDRMQQA